MLRAMVEQSGTAMIAAKHEIGVKRRLKSRTVQINILSLTKMNVLSPEVCGNGDTSTRARANVLRADGLHLRSQLRARYCQLPQRQTAIVWRRQPGNQHGETIGA